MAAAFLHASVHNNEIYGNIVGYLRANHITPPSTEMVQEMMKSKKTPAEMMKEMMDKYNRNQKIEQRMSFSRPIGELHFRDARLANAATRSDLRPWQSLTPVAQERANERLSQRERSGVREQILC